MKGNADVPTGTHKLYVMKNHFRQSKKINLHVEAAESSTIHLTINRREEQCSPSLLDEAFYRTIGVHIMHGIVWLVFPFRQLCFKLNELYHTYRDKTHFWVASWMSLCSFPNKRNGSEESGNQNGWSYKEGTYWDQQRKYLPTAHHQVFPNQSES